MTLPGGVLQLLMGCFRASPNTCAAAGSSAPALPVSHPTTSAGAFPEGHWDPSGSFHSLENLTPTQEIKKADQISPIPGNSWLNRIKI